jgi:vacuolar-type H+-ATPase subunit C/Vma6
MDRARRGYLLAKMYGTVARSYLGANFRDLLRLKSLAELQAVLWPAAEGEAGVSLPAAEMETRISRAAVAEMISVLDSLEAPAEILVHILRRVEGQNLKVILRGLADGRVDASRLLDLGPWASLRVAGVADFEKAVRSSPYAWALEAARSSSRAVLENQVDRDWYGGLLWLARALRSADRTGILRYVTLQISVMNAVWALRLRFSFGMDEATARPLLLPALSDTVRRALARAFAIAPESVEEWRAWRFGWLLADQLGVEAFRGPDPVRAEAAASRRLAVRAHQLLHQHPFTLCPVVGFFALKQHEAALLTTVVESVALGLGETERAAIAGEK